MTPSIQIVEVSNIDSEKPIAISQDKKLDFPVHEEYQYLDLIRDIIANGEHRPDR